jgi:hypothetical protein
MKMLHSAKVTAMALHPMDHEFKKRTPDAHGRAVNASGSNRMGGNVDAPASKTDKISSFNLPEQKIFKILE